MKAKINAFIEYLTPPTLFWQQLVIFWLMLEKALSTWGVLKGVVQIWRKLVRTTHRLYLILKRRIINEEK